ncbi:MAG: hypothetical protein A2Y25_10425 [Candidatus Melainabacteria bacterium GWF2_37_15]|nr:MAG: hypothetical protein A2Y25_10425 [Candidatus Melainabacteria bacterium GWF2_37_15]
MRSPKENFKISVISFIGSIVQKILLFTWKYKHHNFKPEITPAIYAIWHGWQFNLGGIIPRKKLNILISQSNDGEIIARVVESLGFSTIRGSQGRGGMKATREILKALKDGKNIAYTVDGPKGPGFEVKEGIIRIAQMSGKPIIPVFGDANFRFEVDSWDKYQISLPFAHIPLRFGDPIYVPKGEEFVEEYRLQLENELLKFKNESRKKKAKLK